MSLYSDLFIPPKQDPNSKRIQYIDLAKGICIFLVIALHTNVFIPLYDQVQLPLFFFLSGLFFKDTLFTKNTLKKINTLLIPFLAFNIIGEIYFYFEYKYLSSEPAVFEWMEVLTFHKANGVIWFLLSLFIDFTILITIVKATSNTIIQSLIIIVLTITGIFLSKYTSFFNHFYIISSLLSLPYFFLGYKLRKSKFISESKSSRSVNLIIGVSLIAIAYILMTYVDKACIIFAFAQIVGNPIMTYILGLVTIFGLIFICKSFKWLPIFSLMGRYSIIILLTHIFFVNIFVHLQQGLFPSLPYASEIVLLIVTFWSILSIPIMRDYFPYICAQKDIFIFDNGKVSLNKDLTNPIRSIITNN